MTSETRHRLAEGPLTWIFGSSRSGSTSRLRMLAGHPNVMPIDETVIGHHSANGDRSRSPGRRPTTRRRSRPSRS